MMKTIQAAQSPLLIAGVLCGFNFFEDSLGRTRPYLTCLYFAIFWSLYAYVYYYLIPESNITYKYYIEWFNIIYMLISNISIVVSLYQFKKLKICLHLLSIVDDTLEALGTSKEYRRLYNYVLGLTLTWFVGTIVINMMDSFFLNYYSFHISRIFVPFVGKHLFHTTALCSLTWGTIFGYISSRFRKIREHLYSIVKDNTGFISKRSKKNLSEQRLKARKYMWIMMNTHLQLCLISRKVNEVFNIQMTLQMAAYFISFIAVLRSLYNSYMFSKKTGILLLMNRLFLYFWIAFFSMQLVVLNYICQSVCNKANDVVAVFYQLFNSCDEDLYELALQFILQIRQRKLKVSGMGLFDLGYKFIYQFYKAALTVLVIIIQMDIRYDTPFVADEVKPK